MQTLQFDITSNTKLDDIISLLDYSLDEKRIVLSYKCEFINGEVFAVINSYLNYLKSNDIKYVIEYENSLECEASDYLSRINFFKNIGIDYEEKFTRTKNSSLIEITEFNSSNMYEVATKVSYLLKQNLKLSDKILTCIDYCLGEILGNVDMHSNSKAGGLIYAQTFKKGKYIKLIIIDNGDGFLKSFENDTRLVNLSKEEILKKSLEEGFKSEKSEGRGYGLFHVKEFIAKSNGIFYINTCGTVLYSKDVGVAVKSCSHWQGSIIALKINTESDINPEEVFTSNGEYYLTLPFEERLENYNDEQLWE